MINSSKSHLLVAVALLALAALACNRSAATAAPTPAVSSLSSPTPSFSVPAPTPTKPIRPSPSPTSLSLTDTPVPLPSPSPTPVIPSACPPAGDPLPPDRPASFDAFPQALAAYLSAGGGAQGVRQLLRSWGAISDDVGEVRSLDLTGDMDSEMVIAMIDPAPEFDLPWPPGDVLIFQCRGGAVLPVYQGRLAIDQDPRDLQFDLRKVMDVNGTNRADVVYVTTSCGANTCWDRLYILEWDGAGFVNRVPDMDDYPFSTFTVEDGRILVDVGGIGSAGAGYQRSQNEVWEWDGIQFGLTEQTVGPPTARIHFIHDGDEALSKGDYGEAIQSYEAAVKDASLPIGLFLETVEQGAAIIAAYARFKLVVAYAASGDERAAQSQYDALMSEHPEGSPGYPYGLLGQAFWGNFLVNEDPQSACMAAVGVANSNPTLAEYFYAGYANPEYSGEDFCRLPD